MILVKVKASKPVQTFKSKTEIGTGIKRLKTHFLHVRVNRFDPFVIQTQIKVIGSGVEGHVLMTDGSQTYTGFFKDTKELLPLGSIIATIGFATYLFAASRPHPFADR